MIFWEVNLIYGLIKNDWSLLFFFSFACTIYTYIQFDCLLQFHVNFQMFIQMEFEYTIEKGEKII